MFILIILRLNKSLLPLSKGYCSQIVHMVTNKLAGISFMRTTLSLLCSNINAKNE